MTLGLFHGLHQAHGINFLCLLATHPDSSLSLYILGPQNTHPLCRVMRHRNTRLRGAQQHQMNGQTDGQPDRGTETFQNRTLEPWNFFGSLKSWNSNTLATWCKELTHWKRPWCWERLRAGGEGDNRGWDSWMASPTRWTRVWASSGSWQWTGRPGVLRSMGSQRVGLDWAAGLNVELFSVPCALFPKGRVGLNTDTHWPCPSQGPVTKNAQKRSRPQDSKAWAGSQAAECDRVAGVAGAGKSVQTRALCPGVPTATPRGAEPATVKSVGPDPPSASHSKSLLV